MTTTGAHTLLAIAWYTAVRLGTFRGLDLDDYDRGEQWVEFLHRPQEETPRKNGPEGERVVGLPEHVCEIVEKNRERKGRR